MTQTDFRSDLLEDLEYRNGTTPKEFLAAFDSILSNLRKVNQKETVLSVRDTDSNEAELPYLDQPLTFPAQLSRGVTSEEAPRIVDVILLRSTFGTFTERSALANSFRSQIEGGYFHLDELIMRINKEFERRGFDLRLSFCSKSRKTGYECPGMTHSTVLHTREVNFVLKDRRGAVVDSMLVTGASVG